MEALHHRCAGLDVHKATVVACVRLFEAGVLTSDTRTFGTETAGLTALHTWLSECAVTHVALEATGVYWKPVWHVLEGSFELILANAAHVKNVPGRKTDKADAGWIAELLAHGLIHPSFVPPRPIQELRDLTRTRKQLVREMVQHKQRIHKVLEDANVKLASVISDILGASGRAILAAILAGETNPERLADLASGRLKCSRQNLVNSLHGRITRHHRFLISQHLDLIASVESSLAAFDAQIAAALLPYRDVVDRLKTIPGMSGDFCPYVLLAEIGADMSRFPSPAHLVSWAGLCPRRDESAGKKRSARILKGDPWLKVTLLQAAWAASKKKNIYASALFHRIKARRGPKKAAIALASSMLTAAYFIIRDGVTYAELGGDYFERRDRSRIAQRLVRRIRDLGFQVEVTLAA